MPTTKKKKGKPQHIAAAKPSPSKKDEKPKRQLGCVVQYYHQVDRTGRILVSKQRQVRLVTEERYGFPPREIEKCDVIRFDTTPLHLHQPLAHTCTLQFEERRGLQTFGDQLPVYEITFLRNGVRKRLAPEELPTRALFISGADSNTPGVLRLQYRSSASAKEKRKARAMHRLSLGQALFLLAAGLLAGLTLIHTHAISP